MKIRGYVGLIAFCLIPQFANAAGFHCAKASDAFERAICNDPEIFALDCALGKQYRNAMARLSGEGKRILRDGQMQWLRYVKSDCIDHPDSHGISPCLATRYGDRNGELEAAAKSVGPFLFGRSETFLIPAFDESGRPYLLQTAVPRIDGARFPAALAWNAMMVEKSKTVHEIDCDARHGDRYFVGHVTAATADSISVTINDWEYCHGTPHGHGGVSQETYILTVPPRLLEELDVFEETTDWEEFLANRVYAEILKTPRGSSVDREAVSSIVMNVSAWAVSDSGLIVTIAPNDLKFGDEGFEPVVVPWQTLQPYLRRNSPVKRVAAAHMGH